MGDFSKERDGLKLIESLELIQSGFGKYFEDLTEILENLRIYGEDGFVKF